MSKYKQLLKQGNFLTANKILARSIGLQESIFLMAILDVYDYRIKGDLLVEGEWFSASIDEIEEETTLTRRQQDSIVNKLQLLNILEKSLKGNPAKRCFKLSDNFDEVMENILDDENAKQGCTKSTNKVVQKVQTRVYKKDKLLTRTKSNNQDLITNIKNTKKENLEELRKINILAIEEYSKTLTDNPKETETEWKSSNAKLKDMIYDYEVGKKLITETTETITKWLSKQPITKLSDEPNPKARFNYFFEKSIPKCFSYPPKQDLYQQNKKRYTTETDHDYTGVILSECPF